MYSSFPLATDMILGHVVSRTPCHNPVYFIRRLSRLFYEVQLSDFRACIDTSGGPDILLQTRIDIVHMEGWFSSVREAITFCYMVT
jgi:hypothetical protein